MLRGRDAPGKEIHSPDIACVDNSTPAETNLLAQILCRAFGRAPACIEVLRRNSLEN